MARIRTVKPEFWSHPIMSKATDEARLAAIGLLNLADDEGYFLASPGIVRSFIWPHDEDSSRARRVLDELSRLGYVELREHPSQGPIGRVLAFVKHQRVDRANPSKLKDYFDSPNDRRTLDEQSSTDQGSGIREGKGRDQGKEQGNDSPLPKTANGSHLQDDPEAFERAKAAYPAGTYRGNTWILGQRNFYRTVADGLANSEDLIRAATAYREQQEALGKCGTQFVLSPDKFFDPLLAHWRGPFPLPRAGKPSLGDALAEGSRRFVEAGDAGS